MNAPDEVALEVSFPRALLLSAVEMAIFVGACYAIGIPLDDPLLIIFLVVLVAIMTPVFAACLCFMLSCKISREGLRPYAPMLILYQLVLHQEVLRWEDVAVVRKVIFFYAIRGRGLFGLLCFVPGRPLLKHPDRLKEWLERYAPEGNIVRSKLAA